MVKSGSLTSEDVLRSEVPWPAFQSAGIISKDQLELIYTLDKQEVSVQVLQFKAKGALLAQMFIDLVTGVNKDDAICYILAMLEQLMDADGSVALFFARLPCDSVTPFLKLLQRSSLFIVEKAACVVAKILATPNSSDEYLATFAAWTVATLKSVPATDAAESPVVAAAMGGLQSLCSSMTGRTAAIGADALPLLTELLTHSHMSNSASTVQLLYQTLFSLWSLSYSPDAAMQMSSSKTGLIAKLVEIVKSSPKEKVVRVSLCTLRNLLGIGAASNDMVVFGLMPVLEAMQQRKFADEDIPDDVEFMYNALQVNLQSLSSWDVYKTELDSGKLEWSPCHKSENFWKDNHKSFEAANCAGVKQLISLLSSEDPQVSSSSSSSSSSSAGVGWADSAPSSRDLTCPPPHADESGSGLLTAALHRPHGRTAHFCTPLLVPPPLASCVQVLAIVCNDISEFIKFHPEGRRLMTQYGAKPLAMQVLKHPDPSVQKHALTCVQRLMVINWEYLNRG